MLVRSTIGWLLGVLTVCACTSREPEGSHAGGSSSQPVVVKAGEGGRSGAGSGGRAGSAGRRSALSCQPRSNATPVRCGGETCPTQTEFEQDPCFVPCCVTFEGTERCGFRGTSAAFTTECVLPARADPSCDEIPQFQGCCEPTRRVCGIIGGFAPGCQTKSNFVTLPASPKACGANDTDAGASDRDAGD